MNNHYIYGGRVYRCKYRYGAKVHHGISPERLEHIAEIAGVIAIGLFALCAVLMWGAEII